MQYIPYYMSRKKPLLQFRVYPEGRYYFAVVNIWPSKKAMYEHRKTPLEEQDFLAVCTPTVHWKRKPGQPYRRTGEFAEINFFTGALGIGVISHEFTHAMFAWAERRGLDISKVYTDNNSWTKVGFLPTDGVEERCCYALGEMCRQFTNKLYKVGLYEDTVSVKEAP